MTNVKIRRLATLAKASQLVLVLATLSCGARVIFFRSEPAKADLAQVDSQNAPTSSGHSIPALDSFAAIWQRDLRQPLIDPEPVEAPRAKPPPPPPPVKLPRLIATFVEHGQSWGLFSDVKGAQRVRRTGGQIGSFQIVSITPGSASLRQGANTYEVSIPKPKQAPSRSRRGSRRRG